MSTWRRDLHFGDCLNVLREQLPAQAVDLVYLDPPFNSSRNYNLLFKAPDGLPAQAQITAFEDAWQWTEQAEQEYDGLLSQPNTQVAEMINAMLGFLGRNDMMAYLVMLATRLLPMHRALKNTGSLYLHCDPTASHYIKILLDAVFGKENYRNEISWKRSDPKSHNKRNFPNSRDVIFRYTKTNKAKFFNLYTPYDSNYVKKFYRFEDEDGRHYAQGDLTNPNKDRPNLTYEFLGVTRVWRWTKERMQKASAQGLIIQKRPGGVPVYKRYLDAMQGRPVTDHWDDIKHLYGSNKEYLGYPTQKPQALLERMIEASSTEGDVILDPFCGCGTAVHAAEALKRQWIGIDITHLAVALIAKRMRNAFGNTLPFSTYGLPKDIASARCLADQSQFNQKYEFKYWACSLVNAQPYQGGKKGADGGIDGLIYFRDDAGFAKKVVVSVKGGKNIGVTMLRDLKGVMQKQKAEMALLVCLAPPTKPMLAEAASAGFYTSPNYNNPRTHTPKWPKMQVLGIEGLLNRKSTPLIPGESSGFGISAERNAGVHSQDQQHLLGENE